MRRCPRRTSILWQTAAKRLYGFDAGRAGLVVIVLLVFFANRAVCEPSARERALAQSLFDQGRELMNTGSYAEACARLEESQRLDPAAGTELNLAVCHEAEGKSATAWVEFKDALTQAERDGRTERQRLAREHLQRLAPTLSHLTIVIPPAVRIHGLEVRLDGEVLGEAAWGTPEPIDPGTHRAEATAPGKKKWTAEVNLGANADDQKLEVPPLEDDPTARAALPGPAPATESLGPGAPPPADRGRERSESGGSHATLGWISIGVGVVALGVGGAFGLRAVSKWSDRNANCPGGACNEQAVADYRDAKTAAIAADIGVGVGLVAVGVGVYLLVAPSRSAAEPVRARARTKRNWLAVEPSVAQHGGGIDLRGSW